jgi:hypothetical protein
LGEVTNFEDLHLWAIATETRHGYDPETGIRMVTEYIAVTNSGERIIYSKMETILVEWITAPPSEVLDILAEEVGQ